MWWILILLDALWDVICYYVLDVWVDAYCYPILYYLFWSVCESARGGWCALDGVTRLVSVNSEQYWWSTMVLPIHGYFTRDKKNVCVIYNFLVTAKNSKWHS
jgi:hypothetical protein